MAIRESLAENDLTGTSEMLGRNYSISGREFPMVENLVVLSDFLRQIFQLNAVFRQCLVYVVEAYGLSEQPIGGVANIGQRPTVNGVRQQLKCTYLTFKAICMESS